MAYENIRLRKRNVTMVDGYFYMMDEDTDSLIVKTDDGAQAFSYPLNSTIANQILSLEFDGRNFWSLEDAGTDVHIKRWYLDNYVCKLRSTDILSSVSSEAFTVEHYHTDFSGNESAGQTILSVTDNSHMTAGETVVVLGPNAAGQVEERDVTIVGAGDITVSPAIDYSYSTNDPISYYTRVWVFDDNTGGRLIKYNPYTSSIVTTSGGGEYADVKAATFYDMSDVFGAGSDAICYVKTTNTLFMDPSDLENSFGSLAMDNVEDDQATVIDIYDITIEGDNIYRLQLKATYYGQTYTFSDSTYNYQLSTSESFITSISLAADPAILPANGVNNSTITAIVKDQFNLPIASKSVYFTDDDANGYITVSPVSTNAYGVAQTTYKAGTTAREVKITATAQQT